MNNADFENITVAQLRRISGLSENGNDQIIVTSQVRQPELFLYPCRLDAVVLAVCNRGRALSEINLRRYELTEGMSIISLPENVIQLMHISADFSGYVVVVSMDFLRSMQIDLKNVLPLYMRIKSHPCVQFSAGAVAEIGRFYHLLQECVDDIAGKRRTEIVQGLASALIYKICDKLDELSLPAEEGAGNRREALFMQFIELLTEHHRRERSVGFYASRLHITPKYMSSLIKQVSGRSAAQWIDEYVILEAKSLLKYSDLSIQQIAYRLHFSTQSFFGKYFKQHTGISPGQYKSH